MTHQTLDQLVQQEEKPIKEKVVDTLGNITYSLIVGSGLDYFAGLNCEGIVASRTSATGLNLLTGALYGMWRDLAFRVTKTTKDSNGTRKYLTDLLAFNTFQVPVYAAAVAVGSFFSEGKVNWEKVQHGAEYLALISPFIGPTMGWYMDRVRQVFDVKTAPEKADVQK